MMRKRAKSSTWRELKTVHIILLSLSEYLTEKIVKVFTDNQNVVRIACKGRMIRELHQLAMDIYAACVRHAIKLELQWISRELNSVADGYSKIFDFHDWDVSDRIFNLCQNRWGTFTCDLFADSKNKKVKKIYSKFWTPGTSGIDAFVHNWSNENC
jgi:hypothetical protein